MRSPIVDITTSAVGFSGRALKGEPCALTAASSVGGRHWRIKLGCSGLCMKVPFPQEWVPPVWRSMQRLISPLIGPQIAQTHDIPSAIDVGLDHCSVK